MKRTINLEIVFVVAFLVSYTLAASLVSLHRFWQFDAFWYDFGILDETIWQLSRFELPVIHQLDPPIGKIVWSDHFNPTFTLLAPVYWFTGRAEVTLIAQVIAVVVSAGVGYLILRREVKSGWVRLAMLFSYLGFVGLQNALYTDIHNIVFATLPIMGVFYSIYTKRWRLYWLCLILTLGVQENMVLVGVGIGLFLLLRKERLIKIGIATILASLVYGIIITFWIIPHFNGSSYNYQPDFPQHWWEWGTRFFSSDLKTPTIVYTFLTFGGLPILTPAVFPLIIFHFLERFVLNTAATRWDLGFHYNALLSPIMFVGALEAIKTWRSRKLVTVWAFITISCVVVLHRFVLHGPLLLATHPTFYEQTERNRFIRSFVDQVPMAGLLMTQNNIAAHFTHQSVVLLHEDIEHIQPDVVALDLRPGQNANNFFPLTFEKALNLATSLTANAQYKKYAITDSQHLFLRLR